MLSKGSETLRLRVERVIEVRVNPEMSISHLRNNGISNPVISAKHGDEYILVPDNVKIKALPSKYELIVADVATIEGKINNIAEFLKNP